MKITFWGTMGVLLLILVIPSSLFGYIFGKDFSYIRNVIALLAPGILVLATSNAVGYFFAGINQLKILNIKSFVGLGVVLISLYIMVPRYGILGACVATSLSYIASSAVLFYKFYQITRFSFSDFMFSFKEFDKYLKKIKQ